MSVSLFNTMERHKQALPEQERISLYTCGPTVYLEPHIGNWRTFIFYDTLVRVLRLNDYRPIHVMNITDVGHLVSDGDTGEDKMAKTAATQRKTAWQVAEAYTTKFLEGMTELNLLSPAKLPRATDHIPQQIKMIQAIEEAGYTYVIDDGVYFDTARLADYGKLAGNASADEDYARINSNSQKRNPEDFALWKFSPKDERRDMEWESPWGVGFPGWHIECSAMAKTYLGDTIDIHAGGVDHIPIHHTNEIAQSEVANEAPFAHIWMHAEFMKVDGAKMSKSKGNFFTLSDIVEHGFGPLDFRMLVLQGHYRTATNFTWENLQAAANGLRHLQQTFDRVYQPLPTKGDQADVIATGKKEFMDALRDDLNTPKALSVVNRVASLVDGGIQADARQAFIEFFQLFDKAFGLEIVDRAHDISAEQKDLLNARQTAKASKDYAKADALRAELQKAGIELLDTPAGQLWQRC